MCEFCNGTHVVHSQGSFYTEISTCPVCGPVPDEVLNAKMKAIEEKIRAAKEKVNR